MASSSSSPSSGVIDGYPLFYAALVGDLPTVRSLVKELADDDEDLAEAVANVRHKTGGNALHLAAGTGRIAVCKYLLEEVKLDINIRDGLGQTCLHHAIVMEQYPTAVYLLNNSADPNVATTEKRRTPLHCAIEYGPKELVELLIRNGADIEARDNYGTPLQNAATKGDQDAVKILLDNHADPSAISDELFTPLVSSVYAKSIDCVRLLLQAGADLNAIAHAMTPLIVAACQGATEIIKCLLDAGADPNIPGNCGMTPIEYAAVHAYDECVRALFPVTSRIITVPDWSIAGIIRYYRSKDGRRELKGKLKESALCAKLLGEKAFKRNDSPTAIHWYSEALIFDHKDATALFNRSLCWVRLNDGNRALEDAQKCLKLRPNWPKAYHRMGVALKLLKDLEGAADAFYEGWKLDLSNKELELAFREAVEAHRRQ